MCSGRCPAQLWSPAWFTGLPAGAQLDTWPHRGPSVWAQWAPTTGDKQTSPFICHTHALTPHVQAWPRYPAFSSSPSPAAEVCFGCKYKGCKVQAQQCTNAASAALICVTYMKVHPLHHPPRCHRGSQRSQPQQSITLKLPLLFPKALAATSHPDPRCLDRWPQPSSYVSQEAGRMEREREIGHIRVWCWFSLRALKEENSLLIPSCLREVFVRDSPRSLRGHLSCR